MDKNTKITGQTEHLRWEAELKVGGKLGTSPEVIAKMSPDEMSETIYQLRLHEIELEMQNEELRRVQDALENARKRYFDLYDLAPVGYCTLSEKGVILEANLAGARMLEIPRSDLIKHLLTRSILKQDQDIFYLFFKHIYEFQTRQVCELRMLKKDGVEFWVQLTGTLHHDDTDMPVCHLVLTDITLQKRSELELYYNSMHDVLTGVYNRNFFEEMIVKLERGRQYPISILVTDVDNLKRINDEYGHDIGDQVLKRTARLLIISFRADDMVNRIGGDEFSILMSNTTIEQAQASLDRFNKILEQHNASYADIPLQISCGLATCDEKAPLIDTFRLADARMYDEKKRHYDAGAAAD